MFAALKNIFSPSEQLTQAHAAYAALVQQARRSWFYAQQDVPDTVDGRWDVIVLHLFLLTNRLKNEPENSAREFIRAVTEVFFSDMDRSLREMGSTDTGTGKRVKSMAQAYYGRLHAYDSSIEDKAALQESLRRNVYRENPVEAEKLEALTDYVLRNGAHLAGLDTGEITQARFSFID